MRFFLFLALITCSLSCKPDTVASEKPSATDKEVDDQRPAFYVLPFRGEPDKSIQYKGTYKKGLRWMDKLGENVLFISAKETKESVEFWIEHFLKNEKEQWERYYQFYERMDDCELVWTLEPIEEALTVSDLNKDGYGEFTFLYQKDCIEELAPLPTFLYLVENKKEYLTEGSTSVLLENGEKLGGAFEVPAELSEHSVEQAQYVDVLWRRFVR
ncbi:MAG: hypothetical protein AAF598_10345 [Bacteroidota bacterium]